jgi:peptide/nickel transport system permease protein
MNRMGNESSGGVTTATRDVPLNVRRADSASAYRWLKKLPVLPLVLLAPLLVFGILGPLIYPHDPHVMNLSIALQPPAWRPGGDRSHLLGTDEMGRDLFTRLIQGARASLLVGLFGVLLSNFLGMVIGMIAGYFGGRTDQVVMRLVDTWMAIPGIFFTLMFVAAIRQAGIRGLTPIIIAIGLTMWPMCTRMIRAEILSLKQRDFVALARVAGASDLRIMRKHIFPNVMNTLVVMTSVGLGGAIMMESGLSFLGVGVQPPDTAWGTLISKSITYMGTAWWIPAFAGLAITVTILGANLLGDWLRDVLDPKIRQTL